MFFREGDISVGHQGPPFVKELRKNKDRGKESNYFDLKEWCSFIYVASTQEAGALFSLFQ